MLRTVLSYLWLASFLAALLFFARLLCAPSFPKIRDQIKRQRRLHFFWGCWALLTACLLYLLLHPSAWPPAWWERRTQRQEVLRRVQAAGGWAALKRDCDTFAEAHRDGPHDFRWHRGFDTDQLPPTIAALKPTDVQFYPRSMVRQFKDEESIRWFGSNVVLRILIFGAHSTGGHSEPRLGLDVLCEPGVTNYNPKRLRSTNPLRYWRYRKVADDVYEFY